MHAFPSVELSPPQAAAFASGLFTLAEADQAHPAEMRLIEAFAHDFGDPGAAFRVLTPEELAQALPEPPSRALFMRFAILLAHLHGGVTAPERATLDAFARALGMDEADLLALEYEVVSELAAAASA